MPTILAAFLISIFSFAGVLVSSSVATAEDSNQCSSYLARSEVDRLSKAARFSPEYQQHLRCVLQTLGLDPNESDFAKADSKGRLNCKSALTEPTQKTQSQLELLATQNYLVTKSKAPAKTSRAAKHAAVERSLVERYVACQAYSLINVDALKSKGDFSQGNLAAPSSGSVTGSGSAR